MIRPNWHRSLGKPQRKEQQEMGGMKKGREKLSRMHHNRLNFTKKDELRKKAST